MASRNSTVSRNASLNAIGALCNNGYLCYYTGTQPVSPESPAVGDLLCTLRFGSPAFQSAAGCAMSSNPITPDQSASKTGTAGWFRVYKSDFKTPVLDGEIGKDMTMNSTLIQAGAQVSCSSLTITQAM